MTAEVLASHKLLSGASADQRLSEGRAALELLGHFGDLEPAHFGRFDVGAVARDALGELGEALRVARVEVGVGERSSSAATSASSRSISPGSRS